MARPRDARGRWTTWAAVRARRAAVLDPSLRSAAAAIGEAVPRSTRVADTGEWSTDVTWRGTMDAVALLDVLGDADVSDVQRTPRGRYQICGITADGHIRPLSRAYASIELALGEAMATVEGETVMSPRDGDEAIEAERWRGIAINVYLKKDASR